MTPGLELNKLVAEMVMGWKWVTVAGPARLAPPDYRPPGLNASMSMPSKEVPEYSTDIAAAKQVQGKMLETCHVAITKHRGEGHYFCELTPYDLDQKPVIGEGDTEAEAICLAALQAIGLEG